MMSYINKGIAFLSSPGKSFDAEKKTGLNSAFKYMLVLAIILSVMGAIVAALTTMFGFSFIPAGSIPPEASFFMNPAIIFITSLVSSYVGLVIVLVIWGLWLHLWAFVLGAKNGLEQTLKATFYGNTPHYLLGWIPIINIITFIWSIVLMGMGLVKFHGFSGGKAAVAIIIAIVIPGLIIMAFALTFIAAFLPAMGAFDPSALSGLY